MGAMRSEQVMNELGSARCQWSAPYAVLHASMNAGSLRASLVTRPLAHHGAGEGTSVCRLAARSTAATPTVVSLHQNHCESDNEAWQAASNTNASAAISTARQTRRMVHPPLATTIVAATSSSVPALTYALADVAAPYLVKATNASHRL